MAKRIWRMSIGEQSLETVMAYAARQRNITQQTTIDAMREP
jgi:hypothetical protein